MHKAACVRVFVHGPGLTLAARSPGSTFQAHAATAWLACAGRPVTAVEVAALCCGALQSAVPTPCPLTPPSTYIF